MIDALVLELAPRLARDAPHDLELVAVGVGAVERLRHAVVRRAAERARLRQDLRGAGEVVDGRDLPGEVVQPGAARRRGASGPTEKRPRSWWFSPLASA